MAAPIVGAGVTDARSATFVAMFPLCRPGSCEQPREHGNTVDHGDHQLAELSGEGAAIRQRAGDG